MSKADEIKFMESRIAMRGPDTSPDRTIRAICRENGPLSARLDANYFARAQVVDAREVAIGYYVDSPEDEPPQVRAPRVSLPWPSALICGATPDYANLGGRAVRLHGAGRPWASDVIEFALKPGVSLDDAFTAFARGITRDPKLQVAGCVDDASAATRALLLAHIFAGPGCAEAPSPMGISGFSMLGLTPDGAQVGRFRNLTSVNPALLKYTTKKALSAAISAQMCAINGVVLATLGLCHAKNVSLVVAGVSRPRIKTAAGIVVPEIVFRRLRIQPSRRPAKRGAADAEDAGGRKSRWHLVRGHFADYREGRGLFGRRNGIYWVPIHGRGESSLGMVYGPAAVVPTAIKASEVGGA